MEQRLFGCGFFVHFGYEIRSCYVDEHTNGKRNKDTMNSLDVLADDKSNNQSNNCGKCCIKIKEQRFF